MRLADKTSCTISDPQAQPNRRKSITCFGSDLGREGTARPLPQAAQRMGKQKKRKFNRLRRKAKLNFDAFYRQFANDLPFSEIAQRAGISRPRVSYIYADYFSDLLGMTALNRRKAREGRIRERQLGRIRQAIEKDRVLRALKDSATNAGSKRRIEPIL